MKPISLISTATMLVALSGGFISAANGNPDTFAQVRTVADPRPSSNPGSRVSDMMGAGMMRMAMHDDMRGSGTQGPGMRGPGMQGPGMQGPGMRGPGMQGPGMQDHGAMGGMSDLPLDRIEGRIAFLHAELHISEAQMPAWNEFANVLRANAKRAADVEKSKPQRSATSATDRLDDHERWLTVRLESVRALKAAYGKLYAVLDPNQKKAADELAAPHMGIR